MCAHIKIRGQDNLLEVPNELAKEIKKIVLDNSVPRTTPIDLKVMMVDKGAVSAVFLDNERPELLKYYDLSYPEHKQIIKDFENEINFWFGTQPEEKRTFNDYMVYQNCLSANGSVIERNIKLYEDFMKKWSALQILRFLRKKVQQHEAEANQSLEIDVSSIPF